MKKISTAAARRIEKVEDRDSFYLYVFRSSIPRRDATPRRDKWDVLKLC
jgi:hypothetical protein